MGFFPCAAHEIEFPHHQQSAHFSTEVGLHERRNAQAAILRDLRCFLEFLERQADLQTAMRFAFAV